MQDTDPRFAEHVELLNEGSRLSPLFAQKVLEAQTDQEVDELVDQAVGIVNDAADQAWC